MRQEMKETKASVKAQIDEKMRDTRMKLLDLEMEKQQKLHETEIAAAKKVNQPPRHTPFGHP